MKAVIQSRVAQAGRIEQQGKRVRFDDNIEVLPSDSDDETDQADDQLWLSVS